MAIARHDITGLVLAGGQGSRMGGVDKGLVMLGDQPLVAHVLDRLSPQVGPIIISANRHIAEYARYGHPVVTDTLPGFPGPLAGLAAGLAAATTPWVLCVPCDVPHFPNDTALRLAKAAQRHDARLAMVRITDKKAPDGHHLEPAFCLMRRELLRPLQDALAQGVRRMRTWSMAQGPAYADHEDADAFANINAQEDLTALLGQLGAPPTSRR